MGLALAKDRAGLIEGLRQKIRLLEGDARIEHRRIASGVPAIDTLVGGLPSPGVVEICGAPGTGRTRLALALVAAQTDQHRTVVWVDGGRSLYPPAVASVGVALDRLLIVRPGGQHVLWSVEQLARSGCFPLVMASEPGWLGRGGQRLVHAAEKGGCTVVVVRDRGGSDVPAHIRLRTDGVDRGVSNVVVLRDRTGRYGRTGVVPSLGAQADPWG